MKDFLIIGQGAAGSFLTRELLKRKKQIVVVDDDHASSSSIVSAGIINPVTGKRFALTEQFDPFFQYAKKIYEELESEFDEQFFETMDILRIFRDTAEHDHWQRKVNLHEGQQFCKQINAPKTFHVAIKDPLGSVLIERSGFCHSKRLLTVLKDHFRDLGILVSQKFSYDDLTINDDNITFGGQQFHAVIFCEGYRAQWNPYFAWVPFNSVKGEILKIKMQGAELPPIIINRGKWCAPIGNEEWMAGSSYIWDQLDCEPTDEALDEIVCGLTECLTTQINVIEHRAGVRPVIKDQKVVIGRHPDVANVAIFNGLGSKGFLTAPLYASHFADHLCDSTPLKEEISVNRFSTVAE